MTQNTNRLLLYIFVILAIIATFPWWKSYIPFWNEMSQQSSIDLKTYTQNNTSKIAINYDETSITLQQENNTWNVNNKPAATDKIEELFQAFEDTTITTLASRNEVNFDQYDVTETNGIVVTITRNSNENSYIIGKTATPPPSFYIRKQGDTEVYEASSSLRTILNQPEGTWRDKTVFQIPEESLQRLESTVDEPTIIEKQENGWMVTTNNETIPLAEGKQTALFLVLNPLQSTGFMTQNEIETFNDSDPTGVITIVTSDQTYTLDLLERSDGVWWGQVRGTDQYYTFSESIINVLQAK